LSTDAFRSAVEFVLSKEGSFSNLPDDPGGKTKWGISSRVYPEVLDPGFSRDDAIAIYLRDYWLRCKCEQMPPGLGLIVLNCAVNQGQETAIKLLQRSLRLKEDGILGPRTLDQLRQVEPGTAIDEFVLQQLLQYTRDRQFAEFGLGWFRRTILAHRWSVPNDSISQQK
jgi:lysozyme family protein